MRLPKIAVICLSSLLLAACASTPVPTGMLDDAEAAIRRAEEYGAVEHAPIELRLARERLAGARLAVEERNHDRAIRLSNQSIINCDLAIAKTAAAVAREASRKQEESNRQLSEDLGTETGS